MHILKHIRLIILVLASLWGVQILKAQPFPPAAGLEGSDALHRDNAVFRSWAVSCVLERGPGLITYPDSVRVTNGEAGNATGKAGNQVVSLGDGGRATLEFEKPILDGPGPDFAVFENSFDGNFLELGFVEVSSDGQNFFRFPCQSLTPADKQVKPFGLLDPVNIENLAGKYKAGWGTPFDLAELKDEGGLNIQSIIAVRIIDVVGILDDSLGSKDSQGRIINDPFPTPFETGGFDLDAVGVIHHAELTAQQKYNYSEQRIYPNPCQNELIIENPAVTGQAAVREQWEIIDMNGRILRSGNFSGTRQIIHLDGIPEGILLLRIQSPQSTLYRRILKTSG